ncbi:MAG: hypothetical protein RJA52_178 [Bacteroidota bacterium]
MKSRRSFLKTAAAGAVVASVMPSRIWAQPKTIQGVKIGCITYSFRSLPDQSAEATLQYVLDCGINAIELMGEPAEYYAGMPKSGVNRMRMFQLGRKQRNGETLTEEESKELAAMRVESEAYGQEVKKWRASADFSKFEQMRKMYNAAGVEIYGFKPSAFGKNNTDEEIIYGMKAAKALGASHVTLEHPSDDAHTLKLGKMGEQQGMIVAYHGHEQQTFDFWDTALAQSPNNALNLDAGHYIAAGHDSLFDLINKHHLRIMSMHLKDRQTPANGKGNLMWGQGDTPIEEILLLMKKNQYKFPVTIELEYDIPGGSNPVAEVKKCYEMCRKVLES